MSEHYNFLDTLQELMLQQADELRARDARNETLLLDAEGHKLDLAYGVEFLQREATVERSTTLDLAWAAAELLTLQRTPTQLWTRPASPYSDTPILRHLISGSQRQAITAEGWPLVTWGNRYYPNQFISTLALTQPSNANGNNLSVITQHIDSSHSEAQPALPQDVQPLSRTPFVGESPKWPLRWPEPEAGPNLAQDFLRLPDLVIHPELDDKHKIMVYEAYKTSKVEMKIRRAIARVAAQHLIINPEKATRTLENKIKFIKD